MTLSASPLPFHSAPLAAALESLNFRIKRENAASAVVATAHRSELALKKLPRHIQVIDRPLTERRIAVRSARYFQQTRLRIARYPKAKLDEIALPLLLGVVNGPARIYAGDYVLECRPGDFVLIPALVPKAASLSHAIHHTPDSSCDVLYLYPGRLLGDGLECWIAHSQGTTVASSAELGAALFNNRFLAVLFAQLCDEMQEEPHSELTLLLLQNLVLSLTKEIYKGNALMPDIKRLNRPVEHDHNPIKYALTYMEAHLGDHLTIEKLARETALSATNFTRLFRLETGRTFHQHLTILRLELAKKLLEDSDFKVQEIAERIGLSPSHLNRLFHARYHITPGEYRKKK